MTQDVASELARTVPTLDEDWKSTQDSLDLPTVALGLLAARVIKIDTVEPGLDWSPLFAEIEQRLSTADAHAREVLVTGFLEGLQNVSLNAGEDPSRWQPFLGPVTEIAWSALHDLWHGKMSPQDWNAFLARDIPAR